MWLESGEQVVEADELRGCYNLFKKCQKLLESFEQKNVVFKEDHCEYISISLAEGPMGRELLMAFTRCEQWDRMAQSGIFLDGRDHNISQQIKSGIYEKRSN